MVRPISTSELRDILLCELDRHGVEVENGAAVEAANQFVTEMDKAGGG